MTSPSVTASAREQPRRAGQPPSELFPYARRLALLWTLLVVAFVPAEVALLT